MNPYFEKIRNNILVKVSSFNAIGVLVMSLTSLVSAKVIAVLLGAEGMALIGNLRNALSSIQSIGTLGLYNGIVKYMADSKNNESVQKAILSTVYYLFIIAVIVLAIALFFGATICNDLIFGKKYDFGYVFKALAIALPFYSANSFCLAIINGCSKYKKYIIINIVTSIFGLVLTIMFIWKFKLDGAFIAIVLNPVISLIFTLLMLRGNFHLFRLISINQVSITYIKWFGSYAIMALISTTVLPMILIKVRNHIIITEGIDAAGYWEAMQRISSQYMIFITTLLTLYLLPRLSSIHSSKTFKLEVFNFYKIIVPFFALGFIIIYLLRYWIIQLLFSNDFLAMEPLFIWQLLGDIFKIVSLVIAYQLLAKRMIWYYIITEIVSFVVLYMASIYLVNYYGFVGASIAHFCNYVLYFILLILVFRKSLFGPDRRI